MTEPLRIGAVSYLNTAPLIWGLESRDDIDLHLDLPSRLADQLAAGRLDIGLIPCIEFFQNPQYEILSDACIACRGPVWSVMLLSRVPFGQIQTLALDEGSRTSVALVRILLKQKFGVTPALAPFPMTAAAESLPVDAVLMIGDRAMHAPADAFPYQWDLGEQWCEWSGLPFVFAMWVARTPDNPTATSRLQGVAAALTAARDEGIKRFGEIAERESDALGLSHEQSTGYLRDNLHFHLGSDERAGLRRFRELAHDCQLAPSLTQPPWIHETKQGAVRSL